MERDRRRNQSISAAIRPVIEELNTFATQPDVQMALQDARQQAGQKLDENPESQSAWVKLDLVKLGWVNSAEIGSLRVVVNRLAGVETIERHVNSAQFLLVLDGPVETHVQMPDGWRIDRYGFGGSSELADRWHYVASGVWHKSVAPGAANWAIAAFHSAREVNDEFG